ncbi:hypothetical protein AVEN_206031-1 [Araneus ventricosus]|uniref:DUF5641 domain-containing protein n=1 Tax=Araneus ventricosus TaxID=182803 RepID=A0A4Y2VK65_ARAVE|nr:hypothetical protein AVEN_206031-1 [Araneus ventricosus]
MGDLPEDRVNPNFVFNSVGIYFAGKFYIKTKLHKRELPTKIYVCIIICLSTKAIHLELVSDLSFEALIAALKRFMAKRGLLNSRPLTPLSSEVEDLEILTPGHFLIGRLITAIPEPLMMELNDNRRNRWQLLTKKVQTIWKHWSKNYLNNLQRRHKWMFKKDNVQIGAIVLVKEDNVPVSNWPLGRIVKLYPGKDNIIRVVDIKTKTGIFKRSVSRLCVLPIER